MRRKIGDINLATEANDTPKGKVETFAPSDHQGVNDAIGGDWRLACALQLGVEKGDVKAGVVRHERRIADER